MKKILFLAVIGLICASCSLNTDDDVENDYTLTTEEQLIYNTILESELQSLGWNYDQAEIHFGTGFLPGSGDEDYELLKAVSNKMGYDTENWGENEKTATAAVTIFHPNGDLGGTARFYFKNNLITCGYYTYKDSIYSLDTEGVFLDKSYLTAFENTELISEDYTGRSISVPFDGFADISPTTGMTAVIENNSLDFYTQRSDSFELSKSYTQADLGFIPFDISYASDGSCAILAGTVDESGNKASKKVIFLDNLLNPTTTNDFQLYSDSFTDILYNGSSLLLSNKTTVSEFDPADHKNTDNHHFFHFVTGMTYCDIYGNGTGVYAMTDDTNIYVYSQDYTLLWRTYNTDPVIDRSIHFADLNSDGIKEMYVTNTETHETTKYIITDSGFSKSKDTDSGTIYLPGDFDCDTRTEYIYISPTETNLYDR